MTRPLPATLRFMLAARRSELHGLEHLSQTCALVADISRLVHALQKERGYSNLFLSDDTPPHRSALDTLSDAAATAEAQVREGFARIDLDDASSADRTRLFTRIAYALHSLDELPALRRRIRDHRLAPAEATAVFVRLIGGLLAVVFEAADTAGEPAVTRCLVALFNFMQGKELAGQERALGVTGFAGGYFTAELLERLEHLLEGQERCFQTFARSASEAAVARWQSLCEGEPSVQAIRLRDVARRTGPGQPVGADLCELWFELHTGRIDAMQAVEAQLEADLLAQAQSSSQRIREELSSHRQLLDRLADMHAAAEQAKLFSIQANDLDSPPQDGMTAAVARSTLELLQAQTQRLQGVSDELREARQALEERKRVERAKRTLMDQQGFNESEAHAWMRQAAMNNGLRLEDVADRLLTLAEQAKPAVTNRRPRGPRTRKP